MKFQGSDTWQDKQLSVSTLTLGQQFYTTALHTLVTAAVETAAWRRGEKASLAAAERPIPNASACSLFSHYD